VVGFAHAGVTVADMERSLRFYRDLLGFTVEADYLIDTPYIFAITATEGQAVRIVYLAIPHSEVRLELLEYRGGQRQAAASRPCDPGNSHLSLRVANIAAFHRRLVAGGFTARSAAPVAITQGPRAGNQALYAVDPDGYFIEIVEVRG
jgi:glyoxylase I family protein